MSSNLVSHLRKAHADWLEMDEGGECDGARYMREAADEIERLTAECRTLRNVGVTQAEEVENLRRLIRVKDKDYQALRAAYEGRSVEPDSTYTPPPTEKISAVLEEKTGEKA